MQKAATSSAVSEEILTMPNEVAKIVAAYTVSRSWEETRARITL
jgi:hypothetical protein